MAICVLCLAIGHRVVADLSYQLVTDLLCFEFKFTQNKNHDHVSTNSVGMDDKEEESGAETKGLTMVSEACKRGDKKG